LQGFTNLINSPVFWHTGHTVPNQAASVTIQHESLPGVVTLSSVPVDLRALRALKRSPLALDLYAWLTYTAFLATKARRPRTVPWEALHSQMGAEYAEIRMFRTNVRLALKKIQLVYPELKLELTSDGMTVLPSRSAISAPN
jgi:hypothetical protein